MAAGEDAFVMEVAPVPSFQRTTPSAGSDAYLARALRLMLHPGRCKRGGGRNPGGYGEGV